eukprot:gene23499-11970_t
MSTGTMPQLMWMGRPGSGETSSANTSVASFGAFGDSLKQDRVGTWADALADLAPIRTGHRSLDLKRSTDTSESKECVPQAPDQNYSGGLIQLAKLQRPQVLSYQQPVKLLNLKSQVRAGVGAGVWCWRWCLIQGAKLEVSGAAGQQRGVLLVSQLASLFIRSARVPTARLSAPLSIVSVVSSQGPPDLGVYASLPGVSSQRNNMSSQRGSLDQATCAPAPMPNSMQILFASQLGKCVKCAGKEAREQRQYPSRTQTCSPAWAVLVKVAQGQLLRKAQIGTGGTP